jgi:hypothetical protein
MKKYLILVFLILKLAIIRSERCGVTEIFECPDRYTCCQGPTGRICHNVKDGLCCEDMLTCCDPTQSTCDNIEHKCVPLSNRLQILKFLSEK